MTSPPQAKSAEAKPSAEAPSPQGDVKQSFESTYLDYVRAVHRASADAQKRGANTYQAYQREVADSYAELHKRIDDLQRDYVAGIQEAFGRDDASARSDKAYRDAMSAYRALVEEAQRQGEQLNKKLLTQLNQQGEDLQKQYADALRSYLSGLQRAMKRLDDAGARLADLDYLSQSLGAVATYAAATRALPH